MPFPDAWREALAGGAISIPAGANLSPFTASKDGKNLFASLQSATWSGVVQLDTATGAVIHVRPFDHPLQSAPVPATDVGDQVSAGAFDGTWLVWSESHSLSNRDDWTIRAWNSETGALLDLATSQPASPGAEAGWWIFPVVSNGMAAWVQWSSTGAGEVHLFSLASRKDTVLSAGHATLPIIFAWPNVIWQEADPSTRTGHLVMASALTGSPQTPPAALGALDHPIGDLASTPRGFVWDDYASVWISDGSASEPNIVATAPTGHNAEFVTAAGPFVAWDDSVGSPRVADTRSHGVTTIPQAYGTVMLTGSAMIVVAPTSQAKSAISAVKIEVVKVESLPPLSACG